MAVFVFLALAAASLVAGLVVRRYAGGTRVFLFTLTTAVPVAILISWQVL